MTTIIDIIMTTIIGIIMTIIMTTIIGIDDSCPGQVLPEAVFRHTHSAVCSITFLHIGALLSVLKLSVYSVGYSVADRCQIDR